MSENTWNSKYFYGNKISEYGLKMGYVDYLTLSKSFESVLANDIISKTWGVVGEWEQISGFSEDEEEPAEIFQYYIVDNNGADILQEFGEIVYYNEELDLYVWGVDHYGTGWDYVLTNIRLELDEEEKGA